MGRMQFDFGTSFAKANFSSYAGTSSTDVNFGSLSPTRSRRALPTPCSWRPSPPAIAVPLSLLIGVLAALYRYSIFDRIANISTLTSISSPEFFVAYVLILLAGGAEPGVPVAVEHP